MFSLLPTTSVTVRVAVEGPPDRYGNTTLTYREEEVPGCIVGPYQSTEMEGPRDLFDRVLITVHIPTVYTRDMRNAEIVYFNRVFKVLGNPVPLHSSPLPWNRNLICEEIHK